VTTKWSTVVLLLIVVECGALLGRDVAPVNLDAVADAVRAGRRPSGSFLDSRAPMTIDATLQRLSRQPFRAKFHLRGREAATVEMRGMEAVRRHAEELLAKRLAPAAPYKDGMQTPYRGHPVFVAQHATATCCRACLERWHGIPKGRELTSEERAYAVDVICRWIETDLAASGRRAPR
jgi:hypothetical protein